MKNIIQHSFQSSHHSSIWVCLSHKLCTLTNTQQFSDQGWDYKLASANCMNNSTRYIHTNKHTNRTTMHVNEDSYYRQVLLTTSFNDYSMNYLTQTTTNVMQKSIKSLLIFSQLYKLKSKTSKFYLTVSINVLVKII